MTLHLFEPGGSGGVFQHAVAIADILAESGEDVTLHTAIDAELRPNQASICSCMSWERGYAKGPRRTIRIVWHYLTRTVPHIVRRVHREDCLHIQGRFKPGLLLILAFLLRLKGARVIISPHNLFERDGSRLGRLSLRAELSLANSVVVFSAKDQTRAGRVNVEAIRCPLIMLVSPAVPERVAQWRSQWVPSGDKRVVLFAGQLRSDKRLDLLIRTVAKLPRSSWTLAIVGEDKGVEKEMRMLAAALGVKANWHVEYVGLADFSAAVAAADVVVCPYEIASQSGVLALARQLGVPSVACDVGGLGELATITVESDAPSEIAEACVLAVEHSSSDHWEWRQAALDSHLYAYGKAPS